MWRQAWADTANRYLAAQDSPERIDHRSYKRQGIEQIPTVHMGVAATQMERKSIATDKSNHNRQIREETRLLKEVKRRIVTLTTWLKEKTSQAKSTQSINLIHSVPIPASTLREMLNQAYKEADTPQSRYGKIRDLKAYAQAVNFLQTNNITTLAELREIVSDMKKRYWDTNGEIKNAEKLLHRKNELIEQAEKYLKYRPYQHKYAQIPPKQQDAYYEKHRAELTLFEAAHNYLKKALGNDSALKPQIWKDEATALSAEKDRLYSEVYKLKSEVQEAEAVKKCVEQILQLEQTKAHTKRHDIEL